MKVQELLSTIERRKASLDVWLSDHCRQAVSQQEHLSNGTDGRAYWHIGYKAALDDVFSYLKELSEAEERDTVDAAVSDREQASNSKQTGGHPARFLVRAVHPPGRSEEEQAGWEKIAQRVNELGIERKLPDSEANADVDGGLQEDRSIERSVYSFDDVCWELADWMLLTFDGDSMSNFLASQTRELHEAFHQPDYQTDDVDHFSMFLSVYLGCDSARCIWIEMPTTAKAFEAWLTSVDATLLEKFATLRNIGRSWNAIFAEPMEAAPEGYSIH